MSTGHETEPTFDGGRAVGEDVPRAPRRRTSRARTSSTTRRRTYMLSAIVQKVTGQTVLDYLQPAAVRAAGHREAGVGRQPAGHHARRLRAVRPHRGHREVRPALPAEGQVERQAAHARRRGSSWRRASRRPNGSNPKSDWDQGYGFQFWRCRHGAYRGDGAFGQFCIVLPEQDAVVAITAATRRHAGGAEPRVGQAAAGVQDEALPENAREWRR